ncbi:MAG: hypothetical protein KKH91_00180 [Elusimicrobia bacterium]|nr:hypothetical protein [Elusimicrobiota bacterium]MBU2615200.1 hypothetical protein [Elusimicrobiota bacterium]
MMIKKRFSDVGNYYGFFKKELEKHGQPLSYLNNCWENLESWRKKAKGKVFELLAFEPGNAPLKATVDGLIKYDGLVIEKISYSLPYGPRMKGLFLYPEGKNRKLPCIIALHAHGGLKYYGKEKITGLPDEPITIKEHKKQYYGGRSWANEIAKRGFAVLVIDVFPFGSRKVAVEALPENFRKDFEGKKKDSKEYIAAYNHFANEHEHILAKTIFTSGLTWPGIFSYEDRRSVDYVLTRKEVDPDKIGCAGLSCGGLRTIFLGGLDSRIKCAVCIGFMTTFEELLLNNVKFHTWMLYLPHLTRFMDLPDLISLRAPLPLMVQYDTEDQLYTLKGQQNAHRKIQSIYKKTGYKSNYSGKFFPGPHKFDIKMQEDAFAWLEKWLKTEKKTELK